MIMDYQEKTGWTSDHKDNIHAPKMPLTESINSMTKNFKLRKSISLRKQT